MTPVIETYTGRSSIETTLQEMRADLGLETTRGWKEATVLRLVTCLFGLISLVAVLYALFPVRAGRGPGGVAGQSRNYLLRCHHGPKALALGHSWTGSRREGSFGMPCAGF